MPSTKHETKTVSPRIYIDGHVGTTGLRIRDWMAERGDLDVVTLDEGDRKTETLRRQEIRAADIAVLCLPDDAARQAAAWVAGGDTRIIDTSTAHRVEAGWVYGLPELQPEQRQAIAAAKYVANPGCYPTAFTLLVRPLVDAGLISAQAALTIHALSGYSGGGRALIEKWQQPDLATLPYEAPYALGRVHKHVPEMLHYAGLANQPYFVPAVGPFRCGMRVEVPIHATQLGSDSGAGALWKALDQRYSGEAFVKVLPQRDGDTLDELALDPRACNDTNRIELRVIGHPSGHVLLVAVLDNLGKGACGAAIQCLNLMLGLAETTGLQRGDPPAR